MATIRKRGKKWQAQLRLKGKKPTSRSFSLKKEAEAWAKQAEVARANQPVDNPESSEYILLDLLC